MACTPIHLISNLWHAYIPVHLVFNLWHAHLSISFPVQGMHTYPSQFQFKAYIYTYIPIHLVEHEVVGPAEHDGAGRLRLGALEENQLAVTDALFRNL